MDRKFIERARKADESAAEFVRRVVACLNSEHEGILDQLPNVDALLDFFGLFATDYGTDFWQGVVECIAEGDSPQRAREFITRWSLGERWRDDVNRAVRLSKQAVRAGEAS